MLKRTNLSLLIVCAQLVGCAADVGTAPEDDAQQDEVELGSATQGLVENLDVGVIQGNGVNCPGNNIELMIGLDTENDDNNNQRSGWVGATTGSSNTYFHLCRVDGTKFKQVKSANAADNYAVVKLGTKCPDGSVEFTRYFDANDSCGNWLGGIGACGPYGDYEGNITPNSYGGNYGNNLTMLFCMFRASSSAATFNFPNLGSPYGVFGASGLHGTMESGWVYTDDEDDSNNNQTWGLTGGSEAFLEAGKNTKLHMARVR
jgi:hypothetical protein